MRPGSEKIIDGTRYYVNGDRMWIADQWDKMFLPAVKTEKKSKHYKGKNPNNLNELIHGKERTASS